MRVLLAIMLLGAVALAGCARGKASAPTAHAAPAGSPVFAQVPAEQKLIVTPSNALVGKVAKVNPNSRFVVVNFAAGQMPALGQIMPVYRHGLKVGELKISGPQLEDNLVADLVAGEAEAGDDVRGN
jgi:hypothetical protein